MASEPSDETPEPKRRKETHLGGSAEAAARRHQGRMLALQVLYEIDLTDHDPEEAMSRAFAEHDPVTSDVKRHVQALVQGVIARRDALDPVIAAAAPARALAEQAAIERNILRLTTYELFHDPRVPPRAAINEGVELAKRFGGENSGKFVNGVLRTIYEAEGGRREAGDGRESVG